METEQGNTPNASPSTPLIWSRDEPNHHPCGSTPLWLEHCPEEIYQKTPALNASTLRMCLRYPLPMIPHHFHRRQKNDLQLGHLCHLYWLQPELALKCIAILPSEWEGQDFESKRRRAAFQSSAKARGATVIPQSLYRLVERALEALHASKEASDMKQACYAESTIFWHHKAFNTPAKARPDLLSSNLLYDLKCYRGGRSEADFRRSLARQALLVQCHWYREAAHAIGHDPKDMGHLILDTETWTVRRRPLSSNEHHEGKLKSEKAFENFLAIKSKLRLDF